MTRILCNPCWTEMLKERLHKERPDILKPSTFGLSHLQVCPDPHIPPFATVWVFPEECFIEYEKKDEAWAIPLGFGKYVQTKDPLFYMVQN